MMEQAVQETSDLRSKQKTSVLLWKRDFVSGGFDLGFMKPINITLFAFRMIMAFAASSSRDFPTVFPCLISRAVQIKIGRTPFNLPAFRILFLSFPYLQNLPHLFYKLTAFLGPSCR
jgi:hypothetical protein